LDKNKLIDQILRENTANSLKNCIQTKSPCSVEEELDGIDYKVEMIPHQGGALLVFHHQTRVVFDGTLRVLQSHGSRYLGTMLQNISDLPASDGKKNLYQSCLRMIRMFRHAELLHDLSHIESLQLQRTNMVDFCDTVAKDTKDFTNRDVEVRAPATCIAMIDRELMQLALYNLLTNALRVTPPEIPVQLSLSNQPESVVISVADRGQGLNPALYNDLLSGWAYPMSLEDLFTLTRENTPPGFGLPLAYHIAQLHGGSLLLTPRKDGGSELHLSISKLSENLSEELHSSLSFESVSYSLAELEFSVCDYF